MTLKLEIEKVLSKQAQFVKDEDGNPSALALGADGNVGIGTTNPAQPFHVDAGASNTNIAIFESTHKSNSAWLWLKNPGVTGDFNTVGIGSLNNDLHLRAGDNTKIIIQGNGNVGIGTTDPMEKLHIENGNIALRWPDNPPNERLLYFMRTGIDDSKGYKFSWRNDDGSQRKTVLEFDRNGQVCFRGGNVGIGTTSPKEKLEVQGNILATGDVRLAGADCAEDFDVEESQAVDPGTVMVIGDEDILRVSTRSYDKRVAGVLSGAGEYRPGIVLNKQQSENMRMPLALTGKVFCKVDAQHGSIGVGDLLTTSVSPGHAMKVNDPLQAFGAVIGKALRPWTEGQGLIPILIALQ